MKPTPSIDPTDSTQPALGIHSTVEVALGDGRAYPIWIGEELLGLPAVWTACIDSRQVVVVTNATVANLYLAPLVGALKASSREVIEVVLPDGEEFKDMAHLGTILDAMMQAQVDRSSTVVALGGGVVGDMAGFAASCYQRGVAFVQAPTTLLAQVDSSVGGKTGVNHPLGKNMIGAFYQPKAVVIDMSVLSTLPEREFSAGLAEIIKYGASLDQGFFDWLEDAMDALVARDSKSLAYAIEKSCQLKAMVVAEDERESSGRRALLNFGHTFGHAIEAGLGFGTWLHGEAVGCGMVMATRLSQDLGQVRADEASRVLNLVRRAGLPTQPPKWSAQTYLDWMRHDKKAAAGRIRYILLKGIGQAEFRPVDDAAVSASLQAMTA
ncbi:MAG: 3-dehydroquinate synthase [Pseudomonadota bacterium]|jgi:3-dehydroquinate synthase